VCTSACNVLTLQGGGVVASMTLRWATSAMLAHPSASPSSPVRSLRTNIPMPSDSTHKAVSCLLHNEQRPCDAGMRPWDACLGGFYSVTCVIKSDTSAEQTVFH
jgi:hypothetical protein